MSEKGDFKTPILEFGKRLRDAFTDPLRRRNIAFSVVERLVGIWSALLLGILVSPWWLAVVFASICGVIIMLFIYEFVLEPLGLVGHYWERGPRDGETFKNP